MIPYTDLQANGRPDLVTKVQLMEIPIYFAVLYFALSRYGTEGAAIAFLFRCTLDYAFLSIVSRRNLGGWIAMGSVAFLLAVGTAFSDLWSITQPQWWVLATSLSLLITGISWKSVPQDARQALVAKFIGGVSVRPRMRLTPWTKR